MNITRHLRAIIIIASTLLCSGLMTIAQPIQWERTFANGARDLPLAVLQTDDGGWVIGAGIVAPLYDSSDAFVFKVDGAGNRQWGTKIAHRLIRNSAGFVTIIPWGRGGILAVGDGPVPKTDLGLRLIELDSNGTEVRDDGIPLHGYEHVLTAIMTHDGGVTLLSRSIGTSPSNIYLYKVNAQRVPELKQTFVGMGDVATELTLAEMSDGGFLVVTNEWFGPVRGLSVFRIDADGYQRWQQVLAPAVATANVECIVGSIVPTPNGGAVIANMTTDSAESWRLALAKLDSNGTVAWTRDYPTLAPPGLGFLIGGMIPRDGGYAIAGTVERNPVVLHVDSIGEPTAYDIYPHPPDSLRQITGLVPARDNGIMLFGEAGGNDGLTDLLMIKLGAGTSGITERRALPGFLRLY